MAAALVLGAPHLVGAQAGGSRIVPAGAHQISRANATRPHVESHLAVDPRDPRHLIAVSMVVVAGVIRTYPYASFDGGATWSQGRIQGDSTIAVDAGDPVVYITPEGTGFFSALVKVAGVSRSAVLRSTDGGRTWRLTAVLPYADRQWLTFDPRRGPFGGRVYFTGTGLSTARGGERAISPFFARSDDDGRSFPSRTLLAYDRGGESPSVPLNAVPLEPQVVGGGLLILPLQSGPADSIVQRFRRDSMNVWTVGLMVSDDGGDSFGPARYAPVLRHNVTATARRRFRSTSAVGYVRTTIDTTPGRFRSRVYFVASDYDRDLDRFVTRVWQTPDFGKSWTTAIASDAPRGDVANPAIAVNREGVVAVTWNDRRDDPNGRCWQLYAAVSIDGGEHFLPSQRLSTAPTCTNAPANWDTFGAAFNSDQSGEYLAQIQTGASVPARFPMGGDTQGLAADATGAFHAAWINGETGVMQLWHTKFGLDPALVAELQRRPDDATLTPVDLPAGMVDVTREVRFRISDTRLDFSAHAYTMKLEIENQGARTLYGPFPATMRQFLDPAFDNGGGLKGLAAANADSGGPGVGATWIFRAVGGALAPGARTAPRVIRFSFEGGVPEVVEGYLTPGFRILGRLAPPEKPQ